MYLYIIYIYGIFVSKTLTVVLVSFVYGVLKAPMLLVGVSHFWWLLKPIQSPMALPAGEIRLQGICRIFTTNIGHQQTIFEFHPEKKFKSNPNLKKKLSKFARLNRFNLKNNKYINPKDSDLPKFLTLKTRKIIFESADFFGG